jgi:uncharacterized membrane protein
MLVMMAGMWVSSACLAAGLALLLASIWAAEGHVLLRAGLIFLMATPVLRVILSVAEAVRQRDWFWLWTTIAVALILTGTVVYSFRGVG